MSTDTLYCLQSLNTYGSRLAGLQISVNKINLFYLLVFSHLSLPPWTLSSSSHSTLLWLCPFCFILSQISPPLLPRVASITVSFPPPPPPPPSSSYVLLTVHRSHVAISQGVLMPGCLLSGPISSQPQRASMRAELRCLAAGQPSRPISVEAPLWSQVVGSAYREDQQRSVSLPHSLSLHLLPRSLSFLFSALSPFGITSPHVFPSNPHSSIYILSLSFFSFSPPSPPIHAVSLARHNSLKIFSFLTPHLH